MELAVITLVALACSITMSVLAFMVGRCARKLPIDGMLPRGHCCVGRSRRGRRLVW